MTFDFDSLFETMKTQMLDLAKKSFQEYLQQAIVCGQNILDDLKEDIKNWSVQLANREISLDELHELVGAKMDSIEITALTQQGLLEIQAEKLKNGILNLILQTFTSVI